MFTHVNDPKNNHHDVPLCMWVSTTRGTALFYRVTRENESHYFMNPENKSKLGDKIIKMVLIFLNPFGVTFIIRVTLTCTDYCSHYSFFFYLQSGLKTLTSFL